MGDLCKVGVRCNGSSVQWEFGAMGVRCNGGVENWGFAEPWEVGSMGAAGEESAGHVV